MIERLLVVKLDAAECEAQAWLNGLPVLRAGPDEPHAVVAVNEFTLAGQNRLDLCIWPQDSLTVCTVVTGQYWQPQRSAQQVAEPSW